MIRYTGKTEAFNFYADRISMVPNYGFVPGMNLLNVIHRCAFLDKDLPYQEYLLIMDRIEECYRKLMEVNFNEGWN